MITIVDYGMGNLGSVVNMFKRIGYKAQIASDVETIAKAEKILLPGVGSFGNAMALIDQKGFREVLDQKALIEQVPTLGICLGMQLLTRSSEESPGAKGLDWIPAETKRICFPLDGNLKIPHMGWNIVTLPKRSLLTNGFVNESRFYFVHSYCVNVENPEHSIMKSHYGSSFDAGVQKDNIFGAQFHPEKSHKFGMKLFERTLPSYKQQLTAFIHFYIAFMLKTRIIPTLLLRNASLVKTVKFKKFRYIGDPANTVRIFNELEVDELIFLDITATNENRRPNLKVLSEICDECFMPLSYGGGVRDFEEAKQIYKMGFEKIAINSYAFENPGFITQLAEHFGSQAVIGSIDVKKDFWGKTQVYGYAGKKIMKRDPLEWAQELEHLGVGEILLTSIDREGTWEGFDVALTRRISDAVKVPVIAHGGGGALSHIGAVINDGRASAVALGSMIVFQKKGLGVLVNFPDKTALEKILT